MENFVDNGMSMVAIRASSFSDAERKIEILASGRKQTMTLSMVNPKKLDITYGIGFDPALFSVAPPASATSADPLAVDIPFTLSAAAEHKIVSFAVSEYAASINRAYPEKTIPVLCDSPPNAPQTPASAENPATRLPVLGFALPTSVTDDDLASAKITWTKKTGSTAASETRTFSLGSLAAKPAVTPYPDEQSTYRYFALDASNATEGYAYDFEIALIDSIGQQSALTKYASQAHSYALAYDGNGNTAGMPPATTGQAVETVVTLPGYNNLAKTGYAFISWNIKADGSGTRYYAGTTLVMSNADVTLYAQWSNSGTVVAFDVGNVGLSFTPSAAQVVEGGTLTLSCSNAALASGGTNWKWFADGSEIAGAKASTLTWPAGSIGEHIIGCAVDYNGETHSGSIKVTVTQ
jgi:hypothetical protein